MVLIVRNRQFPQRSTIDGMEADCRSLSQPERLVEALGIGRAFAVAVIGVYPEIYSIPVAARVGINGLVYSVDPSEDAIPRPGDSVPPLVKTTLSYRDQLPIPDHSVDVALLAFMLRQIAHLRIMLTEVRRVLRPGGRIVVADWIRRDEPVGPRREERVAAATCERWLSSVGFGLVNQRILNPSHYLIVGRRPVVD